MNTLSNIFQLIVIAVLVCGAAYINGHSIITSAIIIGGLVAFFSIPKLLSRVWG